VRHVVDRLEAAFARARRNHTKVALLFIDLDGFKGVNDSQGHACGDQVLVAVAQRLKSTIRVEDTAARIGGDEFLVVLGDLHDASVAATAAEKLIAALSLPIVLGEITLQVGASIGISIFPDHATDTDALRTLADHAMYRVKKLGKNGFAYAM
jgi:diguanylate cyclase (GGDEF)-like protein